MARYRHALTGRRSPGASAPCFHKRCYSRVADTTQIGSANLPASKARGPISHPSAIAKTPICFSPYLYRAQLSVLKVCVSSADGEVRAGRGARLRRQEAFEEIFCPDHWCVVGERTSEMSPAPRHGEDQSRSLKATIATLKNPRGHPNASAGTNDASKGSGLK